MSDIKIILGTPHLGGFYAGSIRVGDQVFGLVVAPKADGETALAWSPQYTDLSAATSYFDGAANTTAMSEAGLPLGKWAQALDIGGFRDWYLPSRDELELLYRAFKPSTETNYRYRSGDNPSSVPAGYPYTEALPAQTSALPFQEGGAEAFETAWYWSSTQYSRNDAWNQTFDDGYQFSLGKSYEGRARAVRRFIP